LASEGREAMEFGNRKMQGLERFFCKTSPKMIPLHGTMSKLGRANCLLAIRDAELVLKFIFAECQLVHLWCFLKLSFSFSPYRGILLLPYHFSLAL
jgi:hypothetical protein